MSILPASNFFRRRWCYRTAVRQYRDRGILLSLLEYCAKVMLYAVAMVRVPRAHDHRYTTLINTGTDAMH